MSDKIEHVNMETAKCQRLLSALTVISGTEGKGTSSPDLTTILKTRLTKAKDILNESISQELQSAELKKLQYMTGLESLRLVSELQDILDQEETPSSGPPLLGTRDIACIRTILSIIMKWGLEPLLTELELNISGVGRPSIDRVSSIIDLTDRAIDLQQLPDVLLNIMHLMFKSATKTVRQSWITSSLLSNHAVGVLTPVLILGWSSKPIMGSSDQKQQLKEFSIRYISLLRTADATSALGAILASAPSKRHIYPHLSKVCGFLLSKQLMRPDGVQGLYTAVFGEGSDDSDSAPLDKLDRVVKILTTVPASKTPEDYYSVIIPKILALLSPSSLEKVPTVHKRASAFGLSRMLLKEFGHYQVTSAIILSYFHRPFQPSSNMESQSSEELTAMDSLLALQTFLLNTDPSPQVISVLLTPIIPELYSLHTLYVTNKTADPSIRETIHGLLATWSRVAAPTEVVDGTWKIISGYGGDWSLSPEGFSCSTRNTSVPSISLQAVAQLDGTSRDEIDLDANPFDLRPDPVQFVAFLKAMDRKDVSSDILLRLLNGYQQLKQRDRDEDAIQTLLYLQLIIQMQAQLSDAVVSKPEHVLSFIKHALYSLPNRSLSTKPSSQKGLSLKELRIVQEVEEEAHADSDDEDVTDIAIDNENTGTRDDDMTTTAITLLLSVLEGNPDINPETNPDLNDITSALEHVTSHAASPPNLRQLGREARLVLLTRSASTSTSRRAKAATKANQETANDIYQRALKLLQDPIIPVRAHGLQLLRDLLSRGDARDLQPQSRLDPALLPGILSIFLQSIQDQESYIFLNAVQGLAAMVDGYGRGVLKGIMDVYLQGTGIGNTGTLSSSNTMTKEELDTRLRVGEALNNVVRRCGGALPSYTDVLLPPLLMILQSSTLPTTLRVSALSILAQCASTNVTALDSYAARLLDTCMEIIKLEHVPMTFSKEKQAQTSLSNEDEQSEMTMSPARQPDLADSDPTTSVTKAPSLRRSALHLLAQLFRAYILLEYDASSRRPRQPVIGIHVAPFMSPLLESDPIFPPILLRQVNTVISYVSAVDQDSITRVLSNELLELITQYREASLQST